jgi:hypothetical protein
MNPLAAFSLASFQKSLSLLTENNSAESWTILQETGVFDRVTRNEAAIIEESLQEKTGSAEGADDEAVEQER